MHMPGGPGPGFANTRIGPAPFRNHERALHPSRPWPIPIAWQGDCSIFVMLGSNGAWGLVAVWLLGSATAALAGEPPDGGYRLHCAPCHGPTGRGDGPEASLFRPRPRNLRDGVLDRYPVDDLVASVRDGTPLRLAFDPAALQARAHEVEAIVSYLQRLPTIDWRRAAPGEALYIERCETCHGRFGTPDARRAGGGPVPADLADRAVQDAISDVGIANVAHHGHRGMPAVHGLERDADSKAVVAYVRLLSPGFALYARYCAGCHGDDGRADTLVEPGGNVPIVPFDARWLARQDPDALRAKVWHMLAAQRPAMPHYRTRLTHAQAHAILEYLRNAP